MPNINVTKVKTDFGFDPNGPDVQVIGGKTYKRVQAEDQVNLKGGEKFLVVEPETTDKPLGEAELVEIMKERGGPEKKYDPLAASIMHGEMAIDMPEGHVFGSPRKVASPLFEAAKTAVLDAAKSPTPNFREEEPYKKSKDNDIHVRVVTHSKDALAKKGLHKAFDLISDSVRQQMVRLKAAIELGIDVDLNKKTLQGLLKEVHPDADDIEFGTDLIGNDLAELLKVGLEDQSNSSIVVEKLVEVEAAPLLQSLKLQRNDCSRLHKLLEAMSEKALQASLLELLKMATPVVVQHDWLSVMSPMLVDSSEVLLPADLCVFEFKINGHLLFMLLSQDNLDTRPILVEAGDNWVTVPLNEKFQHLHDFCWAQVHAICAMLSAKVAETTTVVAPKKLNDKRVKLGKVPLFDYHIVDLSRRHKTRRSEGAKEYQGVVKLHLRRPHLRHYENGVVKKIDWMLVGNPDLGFVDKHYRL